MVHRSRTTLAIIALLISFLVSACGVNRGPDETSDADVQSGIATGIAATQIAQTATVAAEIAIAQAVDATVTALAAEAEVARAEPATKESEPVPASTNTLEPTPTPPAIVGPPTATPTLTATRTPIPTQQPTREPTPTPPALVILPGGGSGDGMEGLIVTLRDIFFIDDDPERPIFNRQLSLQMVVRIAEVGPRDGSGIDRVEIEVVNEDGDTVYTQVESNAGYCLFGGGEPACNIVELTSGQTWPGTNRTVQDGIYTAYFTVIPDDSQINDGNWSQDFEIRRSGSSSGNQGNGGTYQSDIRAELVETSENSVSPTISGNLVFQVAAVDSNRGNYDGDGINHVVLSIIGPFGNEVYGKREDSAAYCAFGGDSPCGPWVFSQEDYRWPSGDQIDRGNHILRAMVVAESGESRVFDWEIEIR